MNATRLKLMCAALVVMATSLAGAQAQVMPTDQIRSILESTSDGWVAFRNYDGRQLIYFTGVMTWHCGLKEIRYSLNSDDLDQELPVPKCNPQTPFAVDPETDTLYISLPLNSAKTVSIKLTYEDEIESSVLVYEPCDVDGDTTCSALVK